ncbi:ROK family protein [Radiobacillus kanasensis]|uniref:ROK family protein n=1 Tax=Radiobacillus kanasensis TaxID=2844358 RepID=UPI001E5ECCEA|nr:ROK family protein [Radiobacillus kanasensis]UFU00788.1 ROK family protein [Radiobacillus kanasensis]
MKSYLALDIGGTYVKHGIVNGLGEIEGLDKFITPGSLEVLLEGITQLARNTKNIAGIAVSSPGAVSDSGVVYGSSAVKYMHGPNIKKLIAERTGYSVFMENDAHCAAYAELWQGAAKGKSDVMVMVIGTGIGGAVIKNGTIHKGANIHGGEFGYMLLTSDVRNSNDVWSRVASSKALVRKVANLKGMDPEYLTGEEIFEMVDQQDREVTQIVDEWYHLLAIGIYNLQYIYDPEIILIGGGISARQELIPKIREKLKGIVAAIDLAKITPSIEACHFRQNANLLGAVYGYRKLYEELE